VLYLDQRSVLLAFCERKGKRQRERERERERETDRGAPKSTFTSEETWKGDAKLFGLGAGKDVPIPEKHNSCAARGRTSSILAARITFATLLVYRNPL